MARVPAAAIPIAAVVAAGSVGLGAVGHVRAAAMLAAIPLLALAMRRYVRRNASPANEDARDLRVAFLYSQLDPDAARARIVAFHSAD